MKIAKINITVFHEVEDDNLKMGHDKTEVATDRRPTIEIRIKRRTRNMIN